MFTDFGPELIPFFLDLRFHNDRSFMEANRERYYREVRDPFYRFIEALAPAMLKIDPDFETRPHKCLSRINRDIRFSRDKSPYRDHLWLAFRRSAAEKDGMPFYWAEIGPEWVNWGLGVWGENRELMDAMRRRMLAHPEDYLRILPILKRRGFTLSGAEWKKMPVPEEVPAELKPWYLKREIYAEKNGVSQSVIFQSDFADRVARDFTALAPLYQIFRGCAEEAMNRLDEEGGNI